MEYRVKWEIDVSARTPYGAAFKAQQIQRDATSTATVFNVNGIDLDISLPKARAMIPTPSNCAIWFGISRFLADGGWV